MKLQRSITGQIVKETEKALCINCLNSTESGRKSFQKDCWFPKSSLTQLSDNSWAVAEWMVMKSMAGVHYWPVYNVTEI